MAHPLVVSRFGQFDTEECIGKSTVLNAIQTLTHPRLQWDFDGSSRPGREFSIKHPYRESLKNVLKRSLGCYLGRYVGLHFVPIDHCGILIAKNKGHVALMSVCPASGMFPWADSTHAAAID